MTPKKMQRALKKLKPKTIARIERRWDVKMMGPVTDFILSIIDDVNPKARKALKGDEYVIDGILIEERLWKLLAKVRRITKREEVKE